MENELKSLKVLRAQLKGTFTRMQSFVNDASFSNANVEMLQARKDKLNSTLKDYEKVQLDILTIDDQDGESMGHLEEKYFTIISKINERLKQLNSIETSSNSNVSTSKLPNIDLPVFSGKDFTKYTSFMDMFTAVIHNNNTLSDVQKLFYLRKYLSDDALSVIINLPIVNESYKEALTLLKKRFDNQTRLILNHINIILELPSMQKGTATSIRSFISEVEQQLYALKNLKQPTHEWDMMLIAILTKKLDQFTNRAYQLERNSDSLPTMVEFLSFLEKRAMALEDSGTYESYHKKFMQKSVSNVVTNNICKFCNGSNHAIHGCPSFKMAPIEVRHNFILSNKLCTICLKSHFGIKCKFNFQCQKCKKGHNTLLHMDAKPNNDQAVTLSCNDSLKNVVLPTIRVKLFDVQGREFFVRALLDSGSQASFVLSSLSNRLGLKAEPQETNVVSFGNKSSMLNKCVKITLHSPVSNVQLNVNCLITDTITTHLPQNPIDISKLILPANMVLSDDNFNIPAEISLLLGADIYFNILLNNQIKLEGGLLLQNTLFGYVVGGSCVGQNLKNRDLVSNHLTICDHEKLENVMERFWDTEKIPEADVKNAPAIQKAEKCFQDSVKVIDKKFYVDMPLSVDNIEQLQLGDSFSVAFQRFLALEKKFQKYPSYFELYKNFVDEYINLGHAKIVDISSYNLPNDLVYFLGHHAVMNPDSKTTKLRVVFQGNLKSKSGVSLNDVLLNGPVVQSELFDILLLFRTYKFTLISDVKKMFRAINLNPYQNGLQNILWRDNPTKPISCLQLQTVTYGLKPSTFLATRCLIELANNYEDEFPLAAQALRSCTYVDDVLAGADDVEQLYKLKSELIALLDKGSFQLHKWCSNFPGVLDDVPIEHRYFDEVELTNNNMIKTLGLTLNVVEDTFNFTGPIVPQTLKTKRQVLSAIGKIFDPLGLIGPIVIQAKLFMQELWSMSLDWDTILPDKQLQFWNSLLNTIISMEVLTIPRYISSTNMLEVELIGYCDASMKAYGCCLYLRIINNDGSILVNLLCSKTRVAPLNKTLTIPRLELNSAVLLSQLTHRVYNKLKLKLPFKVFLYSDSQITLAWIKSLKIKSNPYVTNRVKDINNLTHGFQWSYVNTTKNPADLLTRSIDPKKLQTTELWWHATPDLLSRDFKHLPVEVNYPIPVNTETLSFPVNYCRVEQPDEIIEIFNKYSDLNKLQRIVAYILRFKNNCLNKNGNMMGSLTPIELNDALNIIIRSVQRKYLSNEIESLLNEKPIKSNLSSLHPFLDQYGILRVGGRLQNASNITYEKMHPIILPKHTYITKLIIEREHLRLLHAGPKLLLSSLSQKYWLVSGIHQVKKVVHKCMKCARLKATVSKQLMGSLPIERLSPSTRAFQVVGIDFCGPFEVKSLRIRKPLISKAYVALFVCFAVKAIHVELVSDLTTENFLACLKRFIARRGLPTKIFCDNAKTFKGAANSLRELYELHSNKKHVESVENFCNTKFIQFKFIPSYAPEFGGLWEAGVKSVKFHLKRIVGNTKLTYEALYTVLTEIEAVLNSRPLLSMSSDVNDVKYLTPGHFLIGAEMTSYPELNLSETPIHKLKFWSICSKLKQDFWKVWSNDYLTQLQNRPKWRQPVSNLNVGDLVIVKNDNFAPLHWPMGRIVKIFTGKDGRVRVVEVKIGNKVYTRSFRKICPLPLCDNDNLK